MVGAHEHTGCRPPARISCEEFQSWSDANGLIHLPTSGAEFTRSNRRRSLALTERRLDRAICNDPCLSFWNCSLCCALPKCNSDHYPIMLNLQRNFVTYSSSFKFQTMWTTYKDCHPVIADYWNQDAVGYPMFILSKAKKVETGIEDME